MQNYNSKFKIIFILIINFVLFPVAVQGAVLYLEPASGEYYWDDVFVAEIKIDTEGEEINAVKIDLTFFQELLEAKDFSQGNSILAFWPEGPSFSNQEGTISFVGGVPGGFQGDGLLGKLVFQTKKSGEQFSAQSAAVRFLDSSQVLLNDGLGTPAELITKEAIFTIFPEKREVSEDQWRKELEKDDIPPESFEIIISQDPFLFEGKYFIVFQTQDKQTGIDYYEVKEGKRDWQRAESPYLLEDQSLKSIIKVKAVDKAGNERMAEITPPYKVTWKDIIPWIILVIIFGLVIWWLSKLFNFRC